jgi:eukaryotic-like serine/threonine-protein kinase
MARALELAKQAVALLPQQGAFWNTLGVVDYRTGDWKAAIGALEKSMKLRSGGDATDWLFLAMAHWQLGEKVEARKWYDRAADWMEKNHSTDNDLRRFRAEAQQVLGLQQAPAVKK